MLTPLRQTLSCSRSWRCLRFACTSSTAAAQTPKADVHVPSRPENDDVGRIPDRQAGRSRRSSRDRPCASTRSLTPAPRRTKRPAAFLAKYGVAADEILKDVLDFWAARPALRQPGAGGGHVLTGPIYVEGAEPGDMLEVQILDLQTRVPYGMNSTGPTGGVFRDDYPGAKEGDAPLDIPEGTRHLIRTGMVKGRHVAMLTDSVHVPMNPFMGIMAVAPKAPVMGESVSARRDCRGRDRPASTTAATWTSAR